MQNETERLVKMLFTCLYYTSDVWNDGKTMWLGVPLYQCATDMLMFQEVIWHTKPDVIIETGSLYGGTAWFFASILEKVNKKAKIISVDLELENIMPQVRKHPMINIITGSSIDPKILKKVKGMITKKDRVMVFLDSDHSCDYVLKELHAYSPFVSQGSHIVVHDTILGGNPIALIKMGEDPGPGEAVRRFLKGNTEFAVDYAREKFNMSFCTNGWLIRR